MKYWTINILWFLISSLIGLLLYLLSVGAIAGLAGTDATPYVDSNLWFLLLIAYPLLVDLFLTLAFRTPVGGLSVQFFPSKRRRLKEKLGV